MEKHNYIMGITYLERWQIDTQKWDQCILSSTHSLSYALSGYLDGVCDPITDYSNIEFENENDSELYGQWGALILNDYEAVFPLPWRKKYGIHYVFQPSFCQQLGLFGNPGILTSEDFLKVIPRKFIKIHLQIHSFFGQPKNAKEKTNFILKCPHLPEDCFNKDALKNIKRTEEAEVYYKKPYKIVDILKIYDDAWASLNSMVWFNDYEGFEAACLNLEKQDLIYPILAKSNDGTNLGGAIFLISPKRIHYVCAGPTEAGKEIGIMHGIINHVAKEFPNHEIDFEGSSIPSVAQFYKKFGPINEPFYIIQRTLLSNL